MSRSKKIGWLVIFLLAALTGLAWAFSHRPAVSNKNKQINIDDIFDHQVADMPEIPNTLAMCDAVGGVWGKIGVGPNDQCNIKTSDGGNGCIDSKACESLCIAELTPDQLNKLKKTKKPIDTRGKCAEWRIVVGCQPVVVEGQVLGLLCID